MEVKEAARRPQGWMAGAAVYGIFGALLPRIAACPLGWAAALLGMLPAALLPRCSLPGRWQKTLRLIRCVWALEVMALSLNLCAEGLVEYDYTGWKAWCPALLMLVLGWRGSYLSSLALERLGKLMFWLLGGMAVALFLLTVPRVELGRLAVQSWRDVAEAGNIFLLTAGAASALVPAGGKAPTLASSCAGSVAVATTTGAEGAALAAMLDYPFLTLCSAAVFDMRMSPFGSAMWALSQCALLIHLLAWFPGGKWVRLGAAAAVFLLTFTLPWPDHAAYVLLAFGAAVGYLPILWSMLHKRLTGEDYI